MTGAICEAANPNSPCPRDLTFSFSSCLCVLSCFINGFLFKESIKS